MVIFNVFNFRRINIYKGRDKTFLKLLFYFLMTPSEKWGAKFLEVWERTVILLVSVLRLGLFNCPVFSLQYFSFHKCNQCFEIWAKRAHLAFWLSHQKYTGFSRKDLSVRKPVSPLRIKLSFVDCKVFIHWQYCIRHICLMYQIRTYVITILLFWRILHLLLPKIISDLDHHTEQQNGFTLCLNNVLARRKPNILWCL